MARPSWDEYFLRIMEEVSKRSTCPRRSIGCVLVDATNKLVSVGYNGVPRGYPHCIDFPCGGEKFKSGDGLDKCVAVHGEINSLLQLIGRSYQAPLTAYLPTTPCIGCAKILCNTDIKRIVTRTKYYHQDAIDLIRKCNIQLDILEDRFMKEDE